MTNQECINSLRVGMGDVMQYLRLGFGSRPTELAFTAVHCTDINFHVCHMVHHEVGERCLTGLASLLHFIHLGITIIKHCISQYNYSFHLEWCGCKQISPGRLAVLLQVMQER